MSHRVREAPEHPAERPDEVIEPTRPVDRERDVPAAERERLEHPRQAEVVVGVVVGEEDLLEVDEADVAAQELALRPFRAVEEEPLPTAPDERCG